jgi:hypothetical protein
MHCTSCTSCSPFAVHTPHALAPVTIHQHPAADITLDRGTGKVGWDGAYCSWFSTCWRSSARPRYTCTPRWRSGDEGEDSFPPPDHPATAVGARGRVRV